jgi:hypothetical protein
MTREAIEAILTALFRTRMPRDAPPAPIEWEKLATHFGCQFPEDFVTFHEVVGRVWFEGELLRIGVDGELRGDDAIVSAYEAEKAIGGWPEDMVPFYSIGNGDYICLSAREGAASRVFCVYHEDRRQEVLHANVEDWIKRLPEYF